MGRGGLQKLYGFVNVNIVLKTTDWYGMKKKTIAQLKKKAWDLLSLYLRTKHGRCQRCGSDYMLQGHHIIRRSKGNSVYLLEDNIVVLCKSCHFWWHKNATIAELSDLIIELIGQDEWDYLESIKNHYKKFSRSELEETIAEYKQKIKETGS